MADKKLPVTQLHVVIDEHFNDDGWAAMTFRHRERAQQWASAAKGTVLTVEPSVGRCETCEFWGRNRDANCDCLNVFGASNLPTDGSGYCCHHEPKG